MPPATSTLPLVLPSVGTIVSCHTLFSPFFADNVGYQNAITLCAEISAAALLVNFWDEHDKINPAVWITIIIILILALNIFAVSIYGEAEFIFASIKIVTILGLLIVGFVIFLGGAPDKDRRGFRYWKEGAMKEYVGTGSSGRFAGLWSTLVNATFSYGGEKESLDPVIYSC
jgi:amino acid transporter